MASLSIMVCNNKLLCWQYLSILILELLVFTKSVFSLHRREPSYKILFLARFSWPSRQPYVDDVVDDVIGLDWVLMATSVGCVVWFSSAFASYVSIHIAPLGLWDYSWLCVPAFDRRIECWDLLLVLCLIGSASRHLLGPVYRSRRPRLKALCFCFWWGDDVSLNLASLSTRLRSRF